MFFREKRHIALLCFAAIVVVFQGCAMTQEEMRAAPRPELTWPAPPMPERIAWRGEVETGPAGSVDEGFWKRLIGAIFGRRETEIVRPAAVHGDPGGVLYVVDAGAGAVHLIDREKSEISSVRGGEGVRLLTPVGICGDGQGSVYISDARQGGIFRYDTAKEELEPFSRTRLRQPTGLAFHPQTGLLYVVETAAHRVVALDGQGRIKRTFGRRGAGEGEFNYPTDVAVAADGLVLVNDALNGRVQIFTPEGAPVSSFGVLGDTLGYFARPKGLALDSDGHIYITDALLDTVQIFDSRGRFLMHFGARGQDDGQFWMPSGIFIDGRDRIFVADSYNKRVQVFEYLGNAKEPQIAVGRGE